MAGTNLRVNTAKQRMLEGKPAIGLTLGLGTPLAAEALSGAGFDYMIVDTQHGSWELTGALLAFRGICLGSATPMARVQQNDFFAIGALLDGGALGIIVPMVNSAEEARAAAFATRFPPRGGRSSGSPLPIALHGADYERWIDDQVFLAVQIETERGLNCAEEILAVEGIDGCWIGPLDLSKSLGIEPDTAEGAKALEAAVLKVLAACRKTNKIPGIWGGDSAQFWLERGFLFVAAGSDAGFMLSGAGETLNKLRRLHQ
jgi:4-hydroxy-2-oxoheptanedioate aldolase